MSAPGPSTGLVSKGDPGYEYNSYGTGADPGPAPAYKPHEQAKGPGQAPIPMPMPAPAGAPYSHHNPPHSSTSPYPPHQAHGHHGLGEYKRHRASDSISDFLLVILTLIFPPIGVYYVAGCGPDMLINIILVFLGFFPSHIHAFYLVFAYFSRYEYYNNNPQTGGPLPIKPRLPLIYSPRVQYGDRRDLMSTRR